MANANEMTVLLVSRDLFIRTRCLRITVASVLERMLSRTLAQTALTRGLCSTSLFRRASLCFDGLHAVYKRLLQNAPANGPEHKAEQASLEVLAFTDDL